MEFWMRLAKIRTPAQFDGQTNASDDKKPNLSVHEVQVLLDVGICRHTKDFERLIPR